MVDEKKHYVILESSIDETFHVTLLPAFTVSNEENFENNFSDDVVLALDDFGIHESFSIVGETEENFTNSNDENVPVLTVKDADKKLLATHSSLLYLADLYGAQFVNPSHIGDKFSPHISHADLTTVLPVFDTVSVTTEIAEGVFEKVVAIKFENGRESNDYWNDAVADLSWRK